MKRIFTLLLVTMLVGQVWAYDFQSGDLYYNITSDSTVEVSKQTLNKNENYSALVTVDIPENVTYEGFVYTVTGIGDYAFYTSANLETIAIPNSVTYIGAYTFYGCSSLESIDIPNSVASIGSDAFEYCTSLTSISIPESVTVIKFAIFRGCNNLTSITIPNTVTDIEEEAFNRCSSLMSITIPNTVTRICRATFHDCGSLTSITIPNSVTIICGEAFRNCGNLQSVDIPNSVTKIESWAFGDCGSLASVSIPNSVTSIGEAAFANCSGLTSISIPESVIAIGNEAFFGCNGLTSVKTDCEITSSAQLYFTHGGIKYKVLDKQSIEVVSNSYSGEIDIPEIVTAGSTYNVVSIGDEAFTDCIGLISIAIPNSVTNIGYSAFSGCNNLALVSISNSVASIGYGTFSNCSSLTSITISDSVTSIGGRAFSNCSSLTSINIPNAVIGIGSDAFIGCDNLLYYEYDNALYLGNDSNHYHALIKGKSAEITSVKINKNCRVIANSAFWSCSNLSSINVENDSVIIDASLCFTKDGIRYSVIAKNTVKVVNPLNYDGNSTYSGDITIPDTVIAGDTFAIKSIGDNAFLNSNLTSINIPITVVSIGNSAFSGCTKLTSINLPSSDCSIGNAAFWACKSLTSITIPSTIKCIGKQAFSNSGLITATINSPTIGDEAFKECQDLQSVILGDSVKDIGSAAFYNCRSLKSVVIPDSVKSIGENAFSYCLNLQCNRYDNALYIGNVRNPYVALICGVGNSIECEVNKNCKIIIGNAFFVGLNGSTISNFWRMQALVCMSIVPPILCGELSVPYDVYVPAESVEAYKAAQWWSKKNILPFITSIVTVESNNNNYGIVSGGGNYRVGKNVRLSATPFEHYHFSKWSDGERSNPRILQVATDTTITAIFVANDTIPAAAYAVGIEGWFTSGDLSTDSTAEIIEDGGCVKITVPDKGDPWSVQFCKHIMGYKRQGEGRYIKLKFDIAFNPSSLATETDYVDIQVLTGHFGGLPEYTLKTKESHQWNAINTEILWSGDSDQYPLYKIATNGEYQTIVCEGTVGQMGAEDIGLQINLGSDDECNIGDFLIRNIEFWFDRRKADDTFFPSIIVEELKYECEDSNASVLRCLSKKDSISIPEKISVDGQTYCVTGISYGAFYGCQNVNSVYIPNSVKNIAESFEYNNIKSLTYNTDAVSTQFSYMEKLESVILEDSVKEIDGGAFHDCSNLKSIIVGASVEKIGSGAFWGCKALSSIIIPDSVVDIGVAAFAGCSSLSSITIKCAVPPTLGDVAFSGVDMNIPVYVPCGSLELYQASSSWNEFTNIIGYHTEVTDTAVAATCTESGLTEGKHCSVCGEILEQQQIIPVKNHSFVVDYAVAATRTSPGLTEGAHCENCDYILVAQIETPRLERQDSIYISKNDTIYIAQSDTVYNIVSKVDTVFVSSYDTVYSIVNKSDTIYSVINKVDTIYNIVNKTDSIYNVAITYDTIFILIKTDIDYYLNKIDSIVSIHDTMHYGNHNSKKYDLRVFSANTNAGIAVGTGKYAESSVAEIVAIEKYGYHFTQWDDGNTDNPRIVNVARDSTFTAQFEVNNYFVLAAANEVAMGTVDGTSEYAYLSRTQLKATPNPGYKFKEWSDGETVNPREILVYSDTAFSAVFMAIDATAITESAVNAVNIYAHGNTIVVENASDEIYVYNAMGALVCKDVACRVRTAITINGSGVYVVKVGDKTQKVVMP